MKDTGLLEYKEQISRDDVEKIFDSNYMTGGIRMGIARIKEYNRRALSWNGFS